MQEQKAGGGESGTAEQNHDESLEAALRQAEEKKPNRRQRTYKHFSEWKNVVDALTLVLVSVTTAFSLALWRAQINANKINGAIYVSSSRPWVMLTEVKPTGLSSDDEAGVSLWAKVGVKNIGHSPAQNVSVSGKLLMDRFDPDPYRAMVSVCRKARNGYWGIPGSVLFPDQTKNVYGENPTSFSIVASRIWAARTKRIESARIYEQNPEEGKVMADDLAKFPFYEALYFVGCINYRGSDNTGFYQTSFMFDIGSFPLLGGVLPKDKVGQARMMQRIIPGNRIKLGTPLYGTFAY